jgi:hypothetical protein
LKLKIKLFVKLKVNKVQETIFSKIGSLLDSRKQKIKESTSANEVFELIGISLWVETKNKAVCKIIKKILFILF